MIVCVFTREDLSQSNLLKFEPNRSTMGLVNSPLSDGEITHLGSTVSSTKQRPSNTPPNDSDSEADEEEGKSYERSKCYVTFLKGMMKEPKTPVK